MEKDIRKFINISDENKFIKYISSLAARTGQEFIATSVASEAGIDDKTATSWLSVLKNTGLIYLLQPYMNNAVGRAIKREKLIKKNFNFPKIYILDNIIWTFCRYYFYFMGLLFTLFRLVFTKKIFF